MRKLFWSRKFSGGLLAVLCLADAGCGYRLAGQGDRLPADLRVLAVTPFSNQTTWMRLEQRLTSAVREELIRRTRFRVVREEKEADAVLGGTVLSLYTTPLQFEPGTGRAATVQLEVRLAATLYDRRRQKDLYSNSDFLFREQYEITGDLDSFFDERGPAMERLSRDFAASLVSALLENF